MLPLSSSPRYNAVAVFLHWLIALAIVTMLAIGWIMSDMDKANALRFPLFQWHKSIGITILLLSLFRLIWRLMHHAPALPDGMKAWEILAAKATHILFYVLIIGMPLTGWVLVSTSKFNIPTMLYGVIPWPQLPVLPTLDNKHDINQLFGDVHSFLAFVIAGLIVLHVGAAWKHHLINRDDVLLRMAPKFVHGILRRLGGPLIVLMTVLALSSPAYAKDWSINYMQSRLGFSGNQAGVNFDGQFKVFQVAINFDPAHPETGKISAAINIASATAGNAERDAYLPQSDWFDSSKFPQATFTSTSIMPLACLQTNANCKELRCFQAAGTLTIKGVTKSVTLPFCLKPEGDHIRAEGKLILARTDFNVGINQWSGDDLVKHEVTVTVSIAAR